ncbi:hypothetical protein AFLA_004071 [Aspergillus flavus NRRL3357]|nr:hypothetical protein AFLA_004071 [Aspergillus flavus NRRL3357]
MFIFSLMDGAALRYNSSEFDCQSIRVDPELSSLAGSGNPVPLSHQHDHKNGAAIRQEPHSLTSSGFRERCAIISPTAFSSSAAEQLLAFSFAYRSL